MRSPHPEMNWARLYLPLSLRPDQVIDALGALATLHGAPRIVLETFGVAGKVQWWIAAPAPVLRSLGSHFSTYLPGIQFVPSERLGAPPLKYGVKLAIRGSSARALNTARTETTSLAILGVLAQTRSDERLVLQLVLGDRLRPTSPEVPAKGTAGAAERRRLQAEKTAMHGFGCTVRIGVCATSTPRARQLIGSLLAALRTAEAPKVTMRLHSESPRAVEHIRSPWLWPLQLSIVKGQ